MSLWAAAVVPTSLPYMPSAMVQLPPGVTLGSYTTNRFVLLTRGNQQFYNENMFKLY